MNLKNFKICLIFMLVTCICIPTFALEYLDWTQYDKTVYEWYKEGDKWKCKKYGNDLIDTYEKIGYNTFKFDTNGFAVGNGLVKSIISDSYFLYDADVKPVMNEYIKVFDKEYYTDEIGNLSRVKNELAPKVYIDLDAFDFDFEKAKLERDQVLANEAAFHSFVDANTEKKTELVFEPYKLGEFILNADGTFTDIKTGDLIRNKAITYEWTEYDTYFNRDRLCRAKALLDKNGHQVTGYYSYGNTVYKFSSTGVFQGEVTDAKEKANALAELDAKKNGYSIVSANTTNNKPVFSEVEVPAAQDKSVVSEIEAPVAHND